MTISAIIARELAGRAYDVGASVLRGLLVSDGERLSINDVYLLEWLKEHVGQEVIIVAASIGESEGQSRTCHTCGREYKGLECPHCRESRRRLRGG